MNYRNLLIVTTGRTGSTLLMGVLNSLPGVLIRGENHNFCFGLHLAHRALGLVKELPRRAWGPLTPFYGAKHLDPEAFMNDARALVRRQILAGDAAQCWGFKEIRYTPRELAHSGQYALAPYLDFLDALFEKPLFVFLTRDMDEIADSQWWKTFPREDVIGELSGFLDAARRWSSGRDNVCWLDYRNIVARDATFRNLFATLGAPYDEARIEHAMGEEYSWGNKRSNVAHTRARDLDGDLP